VQVKTDKALLTGSNNRKSHVSHSMCTCGASVEYGLNQSKFSLSKRSNRLEFGSGIYHDVDTGRHRWICLASMPACCFVAISHLPSCMCAERRVKARNNWVILVSSGPLKSTSTCLLAAVRIVGESPQCLHRSLYVGDYEISRRDRIVQSILAWHSASP
jgi:hypothetical protein